MRTLKTIGLGTLFFFLISVALTVIGAVLGGKTQVQHATALSAMKGGLIEALFSPLFWLAVLVSYGAAFWLVRRHA